MSSPQSPASPFQPPASSLLYACLHRPPSELSAPPSSTLAEIAEQFSPRYERHRDDLVSIDVSGLERLLGPARTIGEELRREAVARGGRVHVAVAATRMAAMVLALGRPGLTVIARGGEAGALAPLPLALLEQIDDDNRTQRPPRPQTSAAAKTFAALAVVAFKRWGMKTLGEVAALPRADLVSRLGRPALAWQAIARGEDIRPLVPTLAEERFDASLELDWPVEDLEPLSFVLTRLLEPLSTRLERRDRGAAVLHVLLRLVTRDPAAHSAREVYARRLELPTPIRDVRTLRTLAMLDLESHPPAAAVDAVTIVIDPTPGRVLQHTLFTRAHPTPEQLSTLVARLGALMGHDRFGAAATVDSYRPGAFVMTPFKTDHTTTVERRARRERRENISKIQPPAPSPQPPLISALRRCRQPVPARVAVAGGRPVRVTTDRRGYSGGAVTQCAGPWRTSGNWWAGGSGGPGRSDRPGGSDGPGGSGSEISVSSTYQTYQTYLTYQTHQPHQTYLPHQTSLASWNRDEWDVALGDGGVYRIFRERDTDRWFVDAIVD
jgi:protein ImuB